MPPRDEERKAWMVEMVERNEAALAKGLFNRGGAVIQFAWPLIVALCGAAASWALLNQRVSHLESRFAREEVRQSALHEKLIGIDTRMQVELRDIQTRLNHQEKRP